MYSKKLMGFFRKPKYIGTIKNADGIGKIGNPVCGDVMKLYIKIKNDKISGIKFETFGCVAAIGTSEAVARLVRGKNLKYAEKITNQDVAKFVGGLPPIKMHCSVLAVDALKAAIADYRSKG
jgi:nitrogen fixation NifU-like protein